MKLVAGLVLVALAATSARAGHPATLFADDPIEEATKATKASEFTKTGSTYDTGFSIFVTKSHAGSLEVNTLQSFEDDGSVLVKGSKQIEAPVTATKMTKSTEASPSSIFGGLYKDGSGGVEIEAPVTATMTKWTKSTKTEQRRRVSVVGGLYDEYTGVLRDDQWLCSANYYDG
uniref:Uncharacterized protein n=1 Tax=Peronospora matthiolae TaxID=2874970 RepID=A0AAV1UMH1_9STRA